MEYLRGDNFSDIVTKKKEGRHSLSFVLKEDGTIRSHINAHTHSREGNAFQHATRTGSR